MHQLVVDNGNVIYCHTQHVKLLCLTAQEGANEMRPGGGANEPTAQPAARLDGRQPRQQPGIPAPAAVHHVQQGSDVEREQPGLPARLRRQSHSGIGQEFSD